MRLPRQLKLARNDKNGIESEYSKFPRSSEGEGQGEGEEF